MADEEDQSNDDLFPANIPTQLKKWKELSGIEWTQRCVDEDWEKDRPKMFYGKDLKDL